MCLISAEVYINAGAHFLRVQKLVKFCKYNKGIKYLLCAIDLFSKYAWVVPLKEKKGLVLLVNAFQKKNLKRKKTKKNMG